MVCEQVAENVYTFKIVLPNNPLKWLNCYVIKGNKNLLIDTGFNRPECREALLDGMRELDLLTAEGRIERYCDENGMVFYR